MRRGSTPTIKLQIELTLDDFNDVWLILKQGSNTLTLKKERLNQGQGYISAKLIQEETLMFSPGDISVQLKTLKKDKVQVSNIVMLPVTDVLDGRIME